MDHQLLTGVPRLVLVILLWVGAGYYAVEAYAADQNSLRRDRTAVLMLWCGYTAMSFQLAVPYLLTVTVIGYLGLLIAPAAVMSRLKTWRYRLAAMLVVPFPPLWVSSAVSSEHLAAVGLAVAGALQVTYWASSRKRVR